MQERHILQMLCITTFYAAYNSKNKPQNMQKYLSNAFNIEQLTKEISNTNTQFIFLKKGKDILGYFKINENEAQTDFQTKDSLELERIYILPELQGNGYGKMMLDETIRIAKSKRKAKVWLGVWVNNNDALRFYKKNGFKITGEHEFMFVDEAQVDWVMEAIL
jgi:ribosomal protein S18 acetylase RimI-like enzyme